MSRRAAALAALLAVLAVAYGIYRFINHERGVQPAIVTPAMDAQQEISPPLSGHLERFFGERVAYGDRARRPKLIALTFDDGPYPLTTPMLLNELRALHVHATFFLIGRDAEQWPELARRIVQYGNEAGDHTYTHPNLDQESDDRVRAEIEQGARALDAIVGDPSVFRLFRPPHGRYTVATVRVAQRLGYDTILWNDDPGDWRTVTAAQLVTHIERHATAPEIVLLHSGKLATIEALPEVVSRFRAAGYRFVTVSALLAAVRPAEINHPAKRAV